jgi:hypothetical protein
MEGRLCVVRKPVGLQGALCETMTSDDKKIKTDPANKNDVPSKDRSTAVDTSKAEGGKIADAIPYSRGEGQCLAPPREASGASRHDGLDRGEDREHDRLERP